MADLGAIGAWRMRSLPIRKLAFTASCQLTELNAVATGRLKRINTGGCSCSEFVCNITKDTTEGNPGQPSLKIDRAQIWEFFWPVASGARGFSVSVKQAANLSPRPRVTVKANADCGVAADATASAASGAGWVTIGPIAVNPTSDGVLIVQLENRVEGIYTPCFWDNISVT